MKCVTAGFGSETHNATRTVAEFRSQAVGLDAELLYGVLSGDKRGQVGVVDVQGGAIDIFGALVCDTSADLIVAPSVHIVSRRIALRLALRHHSRHQCDQIHDVSSI